MELKVEPREALNSLLDGSEVLAVLATGYGKRSYFKRGYSNHLIEKAISNVNCTERQLAGEPKLRAKKKGSCPS